MVYCPKRSHSYHLVSSQRSELLIIPLVIQALLNLPKYPFMNLKSSFRIVDCFEIVTKICLLDETRNMEVVWGVAVYYTLLCVPGLVQKFKMIT